jgi:hypothetical protein
MVRKLTLLVGFGAGYVLGAKAGKERYNQIESKVRDLMGQPAVQDFTSNVTSTASAAADKAKATVNDKVEAVNDKVGGSSTTSGGTPGSSGVSGASTIGAATGSSYGSSDDVVVDLGGTTTVTSGPIAGASASSTAPDVL